MANTHKTIVVVGAGPGVGLEVARRFGRAGYRVGLVRRSQAGLDEMIADLTAEGIQAYGAAADAGTPDQLAEAVTALAEKTGGIDVLHYAVPGPLGSGYVAAADIPTDLLMDFLNARVVSALKATQAALPYLRASRGTVLFTSGQSDRKAFPGTAAIGAPQAALRLLAQHLHDELADSGIHVGYLPLDHPPLYSDPDQERARTDLPAGFVMDERINAADVAEAHFRLSQQRDRFEWRLGAEQIGLAATAQR
ncbi:SDR family NAD(P)-dependent oxidoreductase [Streptomyces sp. NPDC093064]|uniref:SDR family NAD(P)-dependent oxidoreductase n=1 Tax=Streptomyces sp. NPDC093064 TaxID=3366020 RepID=UPI0038086448